MVVGASGFLGRSVVESLAPMVNVVPTHRNSACFPSSIRYDFFKDEICDSLNRHDVSIVVFTAAVERKPTMDFQIAMDRFVRGCVDRRVIYLSSEAVFDGKKGLYSEDDIPSPCTQYGHNLFLSEQLIAMQCPNFCIIRPSYIYGFSSQQLDKRLVKTRKALEVGEEVVLFRDMYKSPLGVQQVAEAVIRLSFSNYIGVVHVAGKRLSVYDFHYQAMEALGVDTSCLKSCQMPSDEMFSHDTSLRFLLWQELTGMEPMSVKQTLSR